MLCTLALILLLDTSASVSKENFDLQKTSIAETFVSEDIVRVISSSDGIALTVIQWSSSQFTMIPWTILRSRKDAISFSASINQMPREISLSTGLHAALQYGISEFDKLPCDPLTKIIDISGDGKDNMIPERDIESRMASLKQLATEKNIIINGLPILAGEKDIEEWYLNHVSTETGFIILANGYEDFNRAMRMKLIREISFMNHVIAYNGETR